MDIRVVREDIFNVESDCIMYFVDNAFTDELTMQLVEKSGDRLLETFSIISSIPTLDFRIVPAFDVKAAYIVLTVLPKQINNEDDENMILKLLDDILDKFDLYGFNTMSVDINRLEKYYGIKHADVFKKFLRNLKKDLVVNICK